MKCARALGLSFVLWLAVSGDAFAQIRTVALSDQFAPGSSGGLRFGEFRSPVLNDLGHVAFTGNSTRRVYSEGAGGGLALVAVNGTPAPGGVSFVNFHRLVLNDSGQLAIEAAFNGGMAPNASGVGLWTSGVDGPLSLVAREGQAAPWHPAGATLDNFLSGAFFSPSPPVLNNAGQTAFRGLLSGAGISAPNANDQGLWRDLGAGATPIAIANDTTTGVAGGRDFVGFGTPLINNRGQILAVGQMLLSGFVNEQTLLFDPNGSITVAASSGHGFMTLAPAKFNDAGEVAIMGRRGRGEEVGIFRREPGGAVVTVAIASAQAPGAPDGVRFSMFNPPVINVLGNVAFVAVAGGDRTGGPPFRAGVWAERGSELVLVASTGEAAPGLDGMAFQFIDPVITYNAANQVAFTAVAGAVGSPPLQPGIWATDAAGTLRAIAWPGMQIDVDNGAGVDLRTVTGVSMLRPELGGTGNEDGLASAFNERGQLAFMAAFGDRSSGVFVSSAVMIPEPKAWPMAAAALATAFTRRPRVAWSQK